MTIKLSTTNSVTNTLQHKTLWDVGTRYSIKDVGTVVAAVEGVLLWTPEMVLLLPLREIHRIQFMRSENPGNREHCSLSTSVNNVSFFKVQTHHFKEQDS